MSQESMYGAAHVILRGGVYQYQRRVPKHLTDALKAMPAHSRAVFPEDLSQYFAKDFVRFTLKTRDKSTAKSLGTDADFEFDTKIKRLEDWLAHSLTSFDVVEPDLIRAIVQRWVSQQLADDDQKRLLPENFLQLKHDELGLYHLEPDFQKALSLEGASLRDPTALACAQALLRQYQLRIDPLGVTFALLHREVLLGLMTIYDTIRRRNAGGVAPTPLAPLADQSLLDTLADRERKNGTANGVFNGAIDDVANAPAHQNVLTLGEVVDSYVGALVENEFKRKIRRCLQLFCAVIGRQTLVSNIRQKQVTAYLREICKLPVGWAKEFDNGRSIKQMLEASEDTKGLSPTTWEQSYKSPLGTFFSESLRDHGEDGFPRLTVDGIGYVGTRKVDENKQRALSVDELKVLFEGPQFRAIAADPAKEELYWLSLVSFFSGARPRELCQINPQVDVGEFEGHWYFDISENSAAGKGVVKTVKTGEDRRLPIHDQLIELGFHNYLQRLKKDGADRIFPNSGMKGGNPYSNLAIEFTNVLKSVGLYDDKATPGRQVLGIYVARKTFVTLAREQHVISKDITGHADDGTTEIQRKHYITDREPFLNKVAELSKFSLPLKLPKFSPM